MEILRFRGRVSIAVRIVTEQYPDAKLYEVNGSDSQGETTDPAQIDTLRVVFQNPGGTVIIHSNGYDTFEPPQMISEPWVGDVIIDWPVPLDLDEANELKNQVGFTEPYHNVTLRNPLGPTRTNPYYIFGSHPGPFVFVDAKTGHVQPGN